MKPILLILLICFTSDLNAQDTLLRYDRNTHKVYHGQQRMKMDDLFKVMRPYPKTFELIKSARDCRFYATVFYTLGAGPLGWVLGHKLIQNEILWPILGVGVGLIGIGIPLHIRFLNQTKRAVNSFNARNDTGNRLNRRIDLSLNLNSTGIGLRLNL
jgi:hypothetical protein